VGHGAELDEHGRRAALRSLWSTEWPGTNLAEDKFSNTDNDVSRRPLTRFPAPALQELMDEWGNPIAYFHRRDYGRTDNYVVTTQDTGEVEEQPVKALMNPATKTYFNSNTFQLISAGIDGKFGTEDDITNFKRD
jgi:hypothetical protein